MELDHGVGEHLRAQAVEVLAEINLLRKRSFVTINNSVRVSRQAVRRFDAQAYFGVESPRRGNCGTPLCGHHQGDLPSDPSVRDIPAQPGCTIAMLVLPEPARQDRVAFPKHSPPRTHRGAGVWKPRFEAMNTS
jgi:hypothetical protein